MRHPIERRALLRALALLVLGGSLGGTMPESPGLTLPQFLRLSTLLTGFEALDARAGERYLAHLHRRRGTTTLLRSLYEQLGLAAATPPTTLDEVSDESLFAREETSLLAEKIVTFWCEQRYSAFSTPWSFTSNRASRG